MLVIINLLIFPTNKIYEGQFLVESFLEALLTCWHGQICKFQIYSFVFYCFVNFLCISLLAPPEPKARVSYCRPFSSVVRRPSSVVRRPSSVVRKLFTFSSSS